ncbi:hypothetical protein [uncultured Thiothrix sp.]|uniref:hypothetical protein n=1 Tax=uncultured Thiothrix sp. TaxID=223185 RepID=UPI0026043ABB|nr:hypothetical protein [uncultured Thiothrix sp.]HMT91602.1 hypothetical protein [Thiolinea sp.]
MDRVTQRRKQGNRLIGQRYLIQTELVNNSTGTLYQARDMRASDTATTPVLIHIFPNKALPSTPLKLMTERLQALSAQTESAVLKVLDSGWINAEAYFVLESPPSWSLSVLPTMLGKTTRLHEQAVRLNQRLNEQGVLTGYLPTSLFLVTAHGAVYLPSTALVPNLLKLTESPELLLHAHLATKPTSMSTAPWLGLGLISVAAASGAGLYYQNYMMTSNELLRASNAALNTANPLLEPVAAAFELPEAQPLNTAASMADKPITSVEMAKNKPPEAKLSNSPPAVVSPPATLAITQAVTTASSSVSVLPNPEPSDMHLALVSEPKTSMNPKAVQLEPTNTKSMQDKTPKPSIAHSEPVKTVAKLAKKAEPKPEKKPEFVEETDPVVNLPSPHNPLIKAAVDTQVPKAQFATPNTKPTAVEVVPAPQPQIIAVAATAPVLGAVHPNPSVIRPASATAAVNPLVAEPLARIQVPAAERDLAALTANGWTSDELVSKAYQALQAGRLDEQANHGAVYFIRLLDRIDHGNPQILRLARETSYQLHQQVRTSLMLGDSEQASQKLWRAGRIIKEFNLIQLNPAQELLEHKLAE